MDFKAGDRAKIVEFGPSDSWATAVATGAISPLGETGTIVEMQENVFCHEGYLSCVFQLDNALLNHLVRLSLFEVKLEHI